MFTSSRWWKSRIDASALSLVRGAGARSLGRAAAARPRCKLRATREEVGWDR